MAGNVSRVGNIFPDVAAKAPVRVATVSTNPPIAHAGLYTLNGVALAEGDRVLDKDQVDQTQNGIWQASSGNWIRTYDASKNTDFVEGTQVLATEGALGAGQIYVLTTTDNPVVIDKGWPVRYTVRRAAWHALDHAWEIEDRSTPTPG